MRFQPAWILPLLALPLAAPAATVGIPAYHPSPVASAYSSTNLFGYTATPLPGRPSPTFTETDLVSPTATPTPMPTPPPIPIIGSGFGLSYSAAVDFAVDPPQAPSKLKADFVLEGGKPMASLSWRPGLAGSYMLRGYRVLRKEGAEPDFKVSSGGSEPLHTTYAAESVEVGKAYDYEVQALDFKGNSSASSALVHLDLGHLDPSRLAPRAPLGVTATSFRDYVKLGWSAPPPWYEPLSSYSVFRDKRAILENTTQTSYLDLSPTLKTLFTYQIVAVDKSGRQSAFSLTATGQATGAVGPGLPRNLSISAKTEKVVLSWDSSLPGTAPISDYILRRITEPGAGDTGEEIKRFSPLDLSRSSYTDSVDGSHFYRYELRAKDAEGNSSAAATVRAWVEAAPFNKTSLLLMPTAYTNNADRDTGLNANVIFDYFVGSLYYSYFSEATQKSSSGVFQPLQVGSVALDLKASMIPETWLSPAVAAGFYGAALINFGSQNSAQTVAASSSGGGFTTLGDVYVVASKRFGFQSAVHIGAMRGNLANDLVSLASHAGLPDWEQTIRHLMPSEDYPQLLNRFVSPGLNVQVEDSPHMLFGGIQFPFTLPLGFTRWKTGLKAEVLAPIFPEPVNRQPGITDVSAPPLMINFHIDNLPLFGFEFSVFEFEHGWEWIAFYHIPDLTWSW